MAKPRTLFSVLLEQPWWISALVGVGLFGIAQIAFPPVAPFVALPFLVIALYVGYRQMRTVSPRQADERLTLLRDMAWEPFSTLITAAYCKQGYEVAPANNATFDFTLTKQGRVTLLQCRRWKVNQLGVGPLEELAKTISAEEAYNAVCICANEFTPKAREFVAGKPIRLVGGIELATLTGNIAAT